MKVSKDIVDIVKAILSPSEIQVVERALESLPSPQNEPRWNVFDKKSTGPNNNRNFQVMPCYEDDSSQVAMVLDHFISQQHPESSAGYGSSTTLPMYTSLRRLKLQH